MLFSRRDLLQKLTLGLLSAAVFPALPVSDEAPALDGLWNLPDGALLQYTETEPARYYTCSFIESSYLYVYTSQTGHWERHLIPFAQQTDDNNIPIPVMSIQGW